MLALVEPDVYAVLDFRGWNQIFPDKPKNLTVSGYRRYMKIIWEFAHQLGWPAQEVDLAIWEFDRRASKQT
jgi:thermostable 8-oxoguanine DNA glycosylase